MILRQKVPISVTRTVIGTFVYTRWRVTPHLLLIDFQDDYCPVLAARNRVTTPTL